MQGKLLHDYVLAFFDPTSDLAKKFTSKTWSVCLAQQLTLRLKVRKINVLKSRYKTLSVQDLRVKSVIQSFEADYTGIEKVTDGSFN